ncbi:MAG: hypothetical protein ACMVO3_08405 [Thalassobaculum sp.]
MSRKARASTRASSTRAAQNPTRFALEALRRRSGERVEAGFAFASGLATIGTLLELLDSWRPCRSRWTTSTAVQLPAVRERAAGGRLGPGDFSFVDLSDPSALEAAITRKDEDGLGRDADQPDCCSWSTSPPSPPIAKTHKT